MGYRVADIISDVRIILDHNDVTTNLAGLSDVDTLNIDTIIRNQIIPSARQLLLVAPSELVDWTDVTGGTLDTDRNVYEIALPDDFLRLGRIKLSGWNYGVSDFVTVESDKYLRQWSEFGGLKANQTRPVVAIVDADDSDGRCTLQAFGVDEDTTLDYCTVVKVPSINATTNELGIGTKLYNPMAYCCASFVAEVLKDTNKSDTLMVICRNLMNTASDTSQAVQAVQQYPQYAAQ